MGGRLSSVWPCPPSFSFCWRCPVNCFVFCRGAFPLFLCFFFFCFCFYVVHAQRNKEPPHVCFRARTRSNRSRTTRRISLHDHWQLCRSCRRSGARGNDRAGPGTERCAMRPDGESDHRGITPNPRKMRCDPCGAVGASLCWQSTKRRLPKRQATLSCNPANSIRSSPPFHPTQKQLNHASAQVCRRR